MAIESAAIPIPSELILPFAGWSVSRGVVEPLTGAQWTYWGAVIAGVLGNTVGSLVSYAVGAFGGRPLLERYGRYVLISTHDLETADRWFARWGDLTVLFSRMLPIVRTFISVPAGIARMPLWRFLVFSIVGAVPWVMLLVLAGMILGDNWQDLKQQGRGIAATATVVVGMIDAWAATELIKLIVRRPRPFEALANAPSALPAPETVIAHPSSYSFPSGDAALAMGAAVAFAYVTPKYRVPVLLLGISAALARVVVGVHYPLDVLGGMTVGIVSGLLAPRAIALLRRRLRWRAFVIPHTHWDREWYERFEGYRARLVPMVSRLLDVLERDPDFRSFTFDGQTIAIQDYLEKRPGDVPRVEALVRSDRLLIGPWHVLADLLLVSGESIVRNLQEGLRSAGELGRAARVAYVADPFGHPAQLPQILRGFGYDTYVFARGMGDEGESVGSEFWWVSPSGDRVRAAHLVDHYSNALPLVGPADEDPAALRRRVKAKTARILDWLTPYANGDAILLMVGDDHVEAYARLPEAVREIRQVFRNVDARIASLEEFAAVMPPLQHVVSGEIASGRYRPILRGVNSTRVWIKQENAVCERLLLEWCEPLDALTGGTARDELRDLWRMLLQNHPHDSICGCSIDAVHDVDMAPRFAYVHERGEALASRLLERLARRGTSAMVWNPRPWARDAVVSVDGVPTRVRAGGLGLSPASPAERVAVVASGDGAIENGVLRVE